MFDNSVDSRYCVILFLDLQIVFVLVSGIGFEHFCLFCSLCNSVDNFYDFIVLLLGKRCWLGILLLFSEYVGCFMDVSIVSVVIGCFWA